ncbi:Integrase catalytic domain-containing protein [Citrus sinensis]|uniref:Integrase catalytic domain-containing protein n=1 Tax=Citrus sinensis TaxID=2711 RepID=A0ACB8L5Y2_CITSI|nr:Integrase catalytic domain-containing protein [Citrus sinensis]
MDEGSSLDDHIDEFNKVCDTLETIDEGLDDEGKALLLVSSLPQSYSNFVDALMYSRQTLSLDEVKAALNTRGLQQKSGGMENGEGLIAKATVEEEEYESAGVCVATENIQRGTKRNEVYVLDGEAITGLSSVFIGSEKDKTKLWHLRLGHMSVKGLMELQKQGVLGDEKITELDFCEDCVLGKTTRSSFKSSTHTTCGILDYIHSDLWGPAQTVSLGGNSYFLSIIDNFSRRVWVYVLKHKDQVFEKFREWKSLVKNQTGRKVEKHMTDNSLEFCNKKFDSYCGHEGIARHKTTRMTPQQNSLAERMNMTLIDKVRCMLVQAQFPKSLWAETLLTACYLVNLSPPVTLDYKTPFELWHGKPISYDVLRMFGCPAYAHIRQGKLSPRALKRQFIGYPEGVKGYKLWCTDLNLSKCIISRDVIFNEGAILENKKPAGDSQHGVDEKTSNQLEVEQIIHKSSEDDGNSRNSSEDQEESTETHIQPQQQTQFQNYQLAKDRKKRQTRPQQRYEYADLITYALAASHEIEVDEPKNYFEAIQSPYKSEWQKAMDNEIALLHNNNTYELVEKTKNRKTVGCKWIFRIKEGLTAAEPRRFKARLTAFLHGRLEEEILMTQPEGSIDPKKPDYVCLLKKSLYCLKQSPRQWYLRFDEFMLSHGYLRCNFDCCVYYKLVKIDLYIYLLLYVDDILVSCKSRAEIEALKQLLNSEFDMKDLCQVKKILGMEIRRNNEKGILFLTQRKYLEKVLGNFGMTDCKSVKTPLAAHFKLSSLQCPKSDKENDEMSKVPYANAVGV